jgi:hypothetical protein
VIFKPNQVNFRLRSSRLCVIFALRHIAVATEPKKVASKDASNARILTLEEQVI